MMYKAKMGFVLAGAVAGVSLAAPAQSAVIVGLYNTGVDNNGKVLAAGQVDTHYKVVATDKPGLVTPAPTYATFKSDSWSANSPVGSNGSSWISPFINANGSVAPSGTFGTQRFYDYVTNFTVGAGTAAAASLVGKVQSDNYVQIYLNGIFIGGQTPVPSPGSVNYFQQFSAFGAAAGFVDGANQLTFRVTDYGVVSGLRVTDLVGTAVPEPGVWAMLIVGFGLVAGQIRRRRRVGQFAIA
jgi:hypothetical protein